MLSRPQLEQCGFQEGLETGPPVLGGHWQQVSPTPVPACLVLPSDFVAVRNTQGDFRFKRSLAINSLEKSENGGKGLSWKKFRESTG